jgi:GTP-binding protein
MTMKQKTISCEFVGSFFSLDQLPADRRVQIAVAGRSNVGKSSLLNRIVGQRKMAKVSSTPGKTRSLNFFLVNNNFYLVDLPGYGYAKVAKSIKASWGKLVGEYLDNDKRLVGLVLLLDCRREPTPEDMELLEWLARREIPTLVVITKIDKLNRDQANRKIRKIEEQLELETIPFSIVSGIGKRDLLNSILDLVENTN